MHRFRITALPILAIAAMFAAACSSDPTPTPTPIPDMSVTDDMMVDDGMMDDGMMDDGMMGEHFLSLVDGWYQGRAVEYYDFGTNSPVTNGVVSTAPIFVFITGFDTDGNPVFVEGQHNIVTTAPGDPGYSDLWRVNLVTVPVDYVADSIRSKADLDAAGFEITTTDLLVNCPIVPEGTVLEGGEELTQGWLDGKAVYYPDFGLNPAETAPIWAFITGFDGDGNPMFVEGQQNVIDVVPGDDGYSAFWEVNLVVVPDGYVANTIKDRAGVESSGYEIVKPGLVVNCPVTFVAEA